MMSGLASEEGSFTVLESPATVESTEFLVRSKTEVVRLLNEIKAQGTLMAISFPHAEFAAVTTLVYVDETSNMLLLECPPEWQGMLESGDGDSIMLACVYDDARIQFQAGKGTVVDLDGVPVVGLDIPEFMWRFQRRVSPRDKVSGLTITLNLGFSECDAEVTDLSMGGVGMFNCDSEVRLEAGEELRGCAIALPGIGLIPVDLTVQHQTPVQVPGSSTTTRVGCQFTGLSDRARQLIAHYLDALADT
jgi:c-di-GMP-binding flagellar brake protein YcgR